MTPTDLLLFITLSIGIIISVAGIIRVKHLRKRSNGIIPVLAIEACYFSDADKNHHHDASGIVSPAGTRLPVESISYSFSLSY